MSYGQTEIFGIMACLVGIALGISFIVDKIKGGGKKKPPPAAKPGGKPAVKKK